MQQPEFIKFYLPNEISEKMDIPIEIMDQLKTEIDNISYLIGPDGKEWLVKFRRCKNEGFFVEGWRDFIKDNCVSSADLLLFQYEGNLRFNVNIFCPSGCESEHALTAKSRQGKGRFVESDGQPMFFKVFIPQYSSAHMLIPIDFVERNMKEEKNDYADLVVGSGEQWRVGFVLKEEGWFFSLGWGLFLADNGIETFDFLVFMYAGKMVFNVKIFGRNECAKLPASPLSPKRNIKLPTLVVRQGFEKRGRGRSHVSTPDEQRVADSLSSTRPRFVRTLKWQPKVSAILNMPHSFLKEHSITWDKQEIVLRFQRNSHHPWCIKVRKRLYVSAFGKGFTEFLRGNNIIDGDVLVFEVFKTSPLEFLVYLGYRPTTES